jgi:hypothetical protein
MEDLSDIADPSRMFSRASVQLDRTSMDINPARQATFDFGD